MNEPTTTVENWVPVKGNPRYEVSDLGRVRSLVSTGPDGGPRILRPAKGGKNGRYTVYLFHGTKKSGRSTYVHHLVAEAFLGPRPDGMIVRHLDDDGANNAASNLAYGTYQDNYRDAVANRKTHFGVPEDERDFEVIKNPEVPTWVPRKKRTECPNGHAYTEDNTAILKDGTRKCLTCARAGYRRHREKKKALAAV